MADKLLTDEIEKLCHSIEALESRNAFQDDVIEQLNDELAIHQSEIAELKSQLKLIAQRIRESKDSGAGTPTIEPPPPHY